MVFFPVGFGRGRVHTETVSRRERLVWTQEGQRTRDGRYCSRTVRDRANEKKNESWIDNGELAACDGDLRRHFPDFDRSVVKGLEPDRDQP
jgi:hypothetical protein